jgi:hypothetical protein
MKRLLKYLGLTATLYLFSYSALTLFGAYAPSIWGMSKTGGLRPKQYEWAPAGFYDPRTGSRAWLEKLYAPLLSLDRRHWHTSRLPNPDDPQHPAVLPRLR